MRLYPMPDWFKPDAVHKAVYCGPGPQRLGVPACKLYHRDCWPKDGCYEPADKTSKNWKRVTCPICRSIPDYGPDAKSLHYFARD